MTNDSPEPTSSPSGPGDREFDLKLIVQGANNYAMLSGPVSFLFLSNNCTGTPLALVRSASIPIAYLNGSNAIVLPNVG